MIKSDQSVNTWKLQRLHLAHLLYTIFGIFFPRTPLRWQYFWLTPWPWQRSDQKVYLPSADLNFCWMLKILSFNFSSLSTAFSADSSSCFIFSPTFHQYYVINHEDCRVWLTNWSSSSIPLSLDSASSARSIARFSSSSCTPSFLLINILCDVVDFLGKRLQSPAQLIQLLLVVWSHFCRLPQVLVQLLQGHLVVQALAFHNFHLQSLLKYFSSIWGGGGGTLP